MTSDYDESKKNMIWKEVENELIEDIKGKTKSQALFIIITQPISWDKMNKNKSYEKRKKQVIQNAFIILSNAIKLSVLNEK